MEHSKLQRLILTDENTKLDFKACLSLETQSQKKELAKDVIAMANSRGGRGYIIFGIEDKTKKVIGINEEDYDEEKIQQVIYHRCDPPIPVNLEISEYEGKKIAILTIYKSSQRPHQMIRNGAFYIRRGSTTDVARREEIANMFQQFGLLTYETVILYKLSIDELDKYLVTKYFTDDIIFLESLGIIGKDSESEFYHPTIGGMILFGKNPELYLPHIFIELNNKGKTVKFTGNVFELMDNVEIYLTKLCADNTYPLQALFEVISNAIAHRDYLDFSNGIIIELSRKYIEIINPGAMVQENKRFNMQKDNIPKRRNPWLYQKLIMTDEKKRFQKHGLGIKRIKGLLKGRGTVQMINMGNENLFKVVLPSFKTRDINSS